MVTDPVDELDAWLGLNPGCSAVELAEHMRSKGWRFVRQECLDMLILSVVDVEGEEG